MYVSVLVSYIFKINSFDVSMSCLYSESVFHRCRVSNVMLREGDYGGGCRVALAHGDGDGRPAMRTAVEGGDSLLW